MRLFPEETYSFFNDVKLKSVTVDGLNVSEKHTFKSKWNFVNLIFLSALNYLDFYFILNTAHHKQLQHKKSRTDLVQTVTMDAPTFSMII